MQQKKISLLKIIFLLVTTPLLSPTYASDLEREQRINDQIIDGIMDGDAIELEANGHSFLGIHMESDSDKTKGAAIILHGRGLHPDWETVIQPLRIGLTESGWHTLSLQMPVLHNEAKYYDYVPLFDEALPRIDAAIAYLKEQGIEKVVLIAHSCGAHMAMHYVRKNGDKAFAAYVGIGMGATDYKQPMKQPFPLDKMTIPIFDVYADNDFPAVLRMASDRLSMIKKSGNPKSAQKMIPGAEHYFNDASEGLVKAVSEWMGGLE